MESRQKKTDKKVASKGHRRQGGTRTRIKTIQGKKFRVLTLSWTAIIYTGILYIYISTTWKDNNMGGVAFRYTLHIPARIVCTLYCNDTFTRVNVEEPTCHPLFLPDILEDVNLAETSLLMAPLVEGQRSEIPHALSLKDFACRWRKDLRG